MQALKNVSENLEISVIDQSKQSLEIAKKQYEETPVGKFSHKINYMTKIPAGMKVDLAIVATSSNVRSSVTRQLIRKNKIKYLVLEKLLFDKKKDYSSIEKLLDNCVTKSWVNCPRKMMPTYQKIEPYFRGKRISYAVTGSKFGLITSVIHFLDHVAYLTGSTEYEINTDSLEPKPIPSKRKGFLEFNGVLTANFKNGSDLSLTCYPEGNAPVVVEIHSNNARYIGRESEGKAWLARANNNWQWEELEAPIPPQSQLTTAMTESILKKGKCHLTAYKKSAELHLPLLESLKVFLNKNSKKKYTYYPFT